MASGLCHKWLGAVPLTSFSQWATTLNQLHYTEPATLHSSITPPSLCHLKCFHVLVAMSNAKASQRQCAACQLLLGHRCFKAHGLADLYSIHMHNTNPEQQNNCIGFTGITKHYSSDWGPALMACTRLKASGLLPCHVRNVSGLSSCHVRNVGPAFLAEAKKLRLFGGLSNLL